MTYIVDAVRTAIGSYGGTLKDVRTDDLASIPIKELIKKHKIDPSHIDDVIIGCANQAGEDNRNMLENESFATSWWPYNVPERQLIDCVPLEYILSYTLIEQLKQTMVIYSSLGVENMTRGPLVISKASTAYGRDSKMFDSSFGWRFYQLYLINYMEQIQWEQQRKLRSKYNISREDQDKFAYNSQMKASFISEKWCF